MRRAIAPMTMAVALLVCGCGAEAALDALPSGGRARVVAAPTGDVMRLADGATVRLAGVEAPKVAEPYAEEARAALARLALGREVELLQGGARQDAYGRRLGQVRETSRRVWLERALLREGAVRVRTYADNRAMARAMLLDEARARTAGRGLWALADYQVRLPQEVGPDQRGFLVVEGRVQRLVQDRGRLVLVFAPGPAPFGAEIPLAARDDFSAGALEPNSLQGRLVRVRGPVRPTRDGPRMWLDHPEQVELLAGRPG